MRKFLALFLIASAFGLGCAAKQEISMNGTDHDEEDVVQKDYSKYDFDKPGFVTKVVDNRLWVFKEGDKELEKFLKDGELAKHVTIPGGGPDGITIKAPDKQTIEDYLAASDEAPVEDYSKYNFDKPGFVTKVVDNRLWVFKEGDKELEKFLKDGELAKHVTIPGGGPDGITIKAPDKQTIEDYLADSDEAPVKDYSKYNFDKPGFVTKVVDNRLWVFKEGDKELEKFLKDGELAKHVTIPGGGPDGITIKAPNRETIDDYLSAK